MSQTVRQEEEFRAELETEGGDYNYIIGKDDYGDPFD